MTTKSFTEWYFQKEMSLLNKEICDVLYEHMEPHERKNCDNFRIDEILGTALGAASLALTGASLGMKGLGLGAKAAKGIGKMASKALEPNEKGWKWLEKIKKPTRAVLSTLWKAVKVLGIATVIGAFIYVGFRFDAIRSLFPMLAPYIDKAGALVGSMTGNFAKNSFIKVVEWSADFAAWIMSKSMDVLGMTPALEQAKKTLMDTSEKFNNILMDAGDEIRPSGSAYDSPAWTGSSKVNPGGTGEFASKYIEPNMSSKSIYSPTSKIDQLQGSGLGGALNNYRSNDDVGLIKNIAGRKK
jgi:hypothetical protein